MKNKAQPSKPPNSQQVITAQHILNTPSLKKHPTSNQQQSNQQPQTPVSNQFLADPQMNGAESFYSNDSKMLGGERVQVALRIRPLQQHERIRNDQNVISVQSQTNVVLSVPG